MLWPVLLGQRLSLMYYASKMVGQAPPYNALTERVWIGRKLSDAEAQRLVDGGVTAVLDLCGEFSEARPLIALEYLNMPVLDLTAPTAQHLDDAVEFMRRQTARGIVYIHCKVGYSRTAAVAGAYLLASDEELTADDAIAVLRAARPGIIIRTEVVEALRAYHGASPEPGRPQRRPNPSCNHWPIAWGEASIVFSSLMMP